MDTVVAEEPRFVAGAGTIVEPGAIVGQPYTGWSTPAEIGEGCLIRTRTVVFADTVMGPHSRTGVGAFIREHTRVGRRCVIGTYTIIDGHTEIEDDVVLQGGVYVPTHVHIGSRVFIGPRAVLTNDRYPLRRRSEYVPRGPTIAEDASIGANATLLPGIHVGRGAMVAAGAVVTVDVPDWSLAVGVPARIVDLPEELKEGNAVKDRP